MAVCDRPSQAPYLGDKCDWSFGRTWAAGDLEPKLLLEGDKMKCVSGSNALPS
jgi:hypothetical protein